jgi:TRAP-type C4-dicarboxylate transport system permease small subunit
MKSLILKIEQWTTRFSLVAACAMLALAACLGLFQIVMRFIVEEPAEWTEVLIRFSLIWMVFLGIPTAFRLGAMVSVDVLYRWSNPVMRRVLDGLVALASLALVIIIIAVGWDYAKRGQVQSVIGLENVTMFWAYLALPAGSCFSVLGIVANFLDPKRLELENQQ